MSLTGKWYGFGRDPHFDAGLRALEAEDAEGAAEAFRAVLKYSKAPDLRRQAKGLLVGALNALSQRMLDKAAPSAAREALREAIELEPGYPDLWLSLAVASGRLEDEATELGAVEKALALNPTFPRAWMYRGLMALRAGDVAGAQAALGNVPADLRPEGPPDLLEEAIRGVFETKGDEANVLMAQADHAIRERQYDVAAVLYRQAVSLQPKYADIRCKLAQTLLELDHVTEAESHLRAALEVNPNYADGWAQLGIALKRQRKFEEAQKAFSKAFELDPSHPIARLERG